MRAVFEMSQSNEMVPAFEPTMAALDAEVELIPAMTAGELTARLAAVD